MRVLFIRRPVVTVCLAVAVLVLIELSLQVRSQILLGRSVLNEFFSAPTKIHNPRLGFQTFRPDARIAGNNAEIVTNRFGLRSPRLGQGAQHEALRVAVVGASTVFGAYAPRNADLMSFQLAEKLDEARPSRKVELLNAGLPGLNLKKQAVLLEKIVLPFNPDIVIFYPGMNDVGGVCRRGNEEAGEPYLVPVPQLPNWVLSTELVKKNTVSLREKPNTVATQSLSPDAVPFDQYRKTFAGMVSKVRAADARPVVATLARSFRPGQPIERQRALSESFRYYYNCFDLQAIHVIYARFNKMLASVGKQHDATVVDLARQIPPGPKHFADATHFSVRGEERAARVLFNEIAAPPTGAPTEFAGKNPDT